MTDADRQLPDFEPFAKLVRVVRFNARQGWMDVRFANPEYAELAAHLNDVTVLLE